MSNTTTTTPFTQALVQLLRMAHTMFGKGELTSIGGDSLMTFAHEGHRVTFRINPTSASIGGHEIGSGQRSPGTFCDIYEGLDADRITGQGAQALRMFRAIKGVQLALN